MAEVENIDLEDKQLRYRVSGLDSPQTFHYDHLILATGSVTKLPDVPGLREHGFEMKGLHDSVLMRDRGIRLLEIANNIESAEERRAMLRVFVVGSNFTGIEFAGEYQDFMQEARKSYANVDEKDIEVFLLEYADRILPAIDPDLGDYARRQLEARGLQIRTGTSLREIQEREVTLTTGETMRSRTVVWCAGIAPNPLVSQAAGLPLGQRGYIRCERTMKVQGFDDVWAIGDIAAILDADGKPYGTTAQNATRQGVQVAKNVIAVIRGEQPVPFAFKPRGSLAAIGRRRAVANLMGFKIAGFLAWFIYRTVYVMKMPGFWRKVRIIADWTIDLFIKSEPVQLGLRRPDASVFDPPGKADKPLSRR